MKPTINDDSYIWIDRGDCRPKEGEIYAFLLDDDTVTIKRLVKIHKKYVIIDGDNQNPRERQFEELNNFPTSVAIKEDISIIRGRVIWVLNRLIEKPEIK